MAFNLKNDQSLERIKRRLNQKTSSIDVEVIPVSSRMKKGHHKTTSDFNVRGYLGSLEGLKSSSNHLLFKRSFGEASNSKTSTLKKQKKNIKKTSSRKRIGSSENEPKISMRTGGSTSSSSKFSLIYSSRLFGAKNSISKRKNSCKNFKRKSSKKTNENRPLFSKGKRSIGSINEMNFMDLRVSHGITAAKGSARLRNFEQAPQLTEKPKKTGKLSKNHKYTQSEPEVLKNFKFSKKKSDLGTELIKRRES